MDPRFYAVNFNTPSSPESGYYASSPGSTMNMTPEYTGNAQNYPDFINVQGVSLIAPKTPQNFFRFRYESEMHGTHGSLMGKDSSREIKTFPTVRLLGAELLPNNSTVRIRCTLAQADRTNDEIPHSHKLVIKSGEQERYDPHFVEANFQNGYTVEFKGMGIIHTAKKDIIKELGAKLIRLKEFELERPLTDLERNIELTKVQKLNVKSMNLNQVCLCFEAFCYDVNFQKWIKICPGIYSEPINNIKSALTGELKICNYSTCVSPAAGDQEVYLLVEKVNRGDIKVRFFDNEGWQDFARVDTVHHQYAIVMRTPPYKLQTITSPVQVWFHLYRTKDGCASMEREFTYKPNEIQEIPGQKRKMRRVEEENIIPTPITELVSSTTTSTIDEEINLDFDLDYPLTPEDQEKVEQILEDLEQGTLDFDSVPEKKEDTKSIKKVKDVHELLTEIIKKGDDNSFENILKLVKNHKMLQKLVNMQDISFGGKRMTLLHLCCIYGRSTYLKELIDKSTDLNIVNIDGNNVLHLCVEFNKIDCLKTLLSHKSKISMDNKNYKGWTPLHLAVKRDLLPIVRILVENGANLLSTRQTLTFETVLHTAVEQKSLEMVKFILKITGTQLLNTFNGTDKTPLDILYDSTAKLDATQQEIARILLSLGGWSSHINENESSDDHQRTYEEVESDEEDENVSNIEPPIENAFKEMSLNQSAPKNPIKFDKKGKEDLCAILNGTNSWQQCAQLLDLENLCDIWGRQDNPSDCLLAYIEGCAFELQTVIDTLQMLQLTEAICVVDAMIARQLS
ncbi:nuclear factor NF-kappa-B p110 subunit isoform X2 [Culicoides brevitarsis]|uniref:nuclear factor NF-kappa-B p110 subunit isoform X2 n=1 Tax=Culicoides brevitarsis TaxID=469753 RepID=UPI00307B7839